jgi:hypothetical protein
MYILLAYVSLGVLTFAQKTESESRNAATPPRAAITDSNLNEDEESV